MRRSWGRGCSTLPRQSVHGDASHDEFIAQVYDVLHFTPVSGLCAITKYNELGDSQRDARPTRCRVCAPPRGTHPHEEAFDEAAHRVGGLQQPAAATLISRAIDANGLPADIHDFQDTRAA